MLSSQEHRTSLSTPLSPILMQHAAMEGYNAVVFAYSHIASGKTYYLSGDSAGEEPGIIPRAMKDVFSFFRKTEEREYILRCSCLEIHNESIVNLQWLQYSQ